LYHFNKKPASGSIAFIFRYGQKEAPENLYEIQKKLSILDKKGSKTIVPFLTGDAMKVLLEQPDTTTKEGRRDLDLLLVCMTQQHEYRN